MATRSFRVALALGFLGAQLFALQACEAVLGLGNKTDLPETDAQSDAPVVTDSPTSLDTGSPHDAPSPGDTSAIADSASDGPAPESDGCGGGSCSDVTCTGTEVACKAGCFDLTSSSGNCGACGHDCGAGATCSNSACTTATLLTGIDAPTAFTIDSTSIYFAVDDSLKSCALTGCSGGQTSIAAFTNIDVVQVVNGTIAFQGTAQSGNHPATALYACPVSGCVTPYTIESALIAGNFPQLVGFGNDLYYVVTFAANQTQSSSITQCLGLSTAGCASTVTITSAQSWPFVVDGTNVYFSSLVDDDGSYVPTGISSCPSGAACTAPTVVTNGESGNTYTPTFMAVTGGTIYFVSGDHFTGGTLFSCPISDCSAPTSLDHLDYAITSLTADPSGIYFTGTEASNTGVFSCPLSGCAAGPVTLASGQVSPASIVTDDSFVYWVDEGTLLGDGGYATGTGSINRVAKP